MFFLIDKKSNIVLVEIISNSYMTIDEALTLFDLTIAEDGEIITKDGRATGAYFEDIEIVIK